MLRAASASPPRNPATHGCILTRAVSVSASKDVLKLDRRRSSDFSPEARLRVQEAPRDRRHETTLARSSRRGGRHLRRPVRARPVAPGSSAGPSPQIRRRFRLGPQRPGAVGLERCALPRCLQRSNPEEPQMLNPPPAAGPRVIGQEPHRRFPEANRLRHVNGEPAQGRVIQGSILTAGGISEDWSATLAGRALCTVMANRSPCAVGPDRL